MFGMLKKAGFVGGLVALARSPKGQEMIGRAKVYANDPETRRKLSELKTKMMAKKNAR